MGGIIKVVRTVCVGAVAACAGMCSSALAAGPSFTIIPPVTGEISSSAYSVSGNGQYVLGSSNVAGGGQRYWTWTPSTGRVNFSATPGWASEAFYGIANNGNVAGAAVVTGLPVEATIRRAGESVSTRLGNISGASPPYEYMTPRAISDDGRTVIGESQSRDNYQAWVSRDGAHVSGIGWAPGDTRLYSSARAMNSDGSIIVGDGTTTAFEYRDGRMRNLPDPPGTVLASTATAVTSSGNAIAGDYFPDLNGQNQAVVWDAARTPKVLGNPNPASGIPSLGVVGISDDAKLVAMFTASLGVSNAEAWIWSEGRGFTRLFDYAAGLGVTVPVGLSRSSVYAMSRDGLTFVGASRNNSGVDVGWIITIPSPGSIGSLGGLGLLLAQRRHRRR